MTRRPSSASERERPDWHRSLPILLLAVVAALVVACGGASNTGGSATPSHATATSDDGASTSPDSSAAPSEEPSASETAPPEPTPTVTPVSGPSDSPTAAPTPTPSGASGPAARCTGNAENRDFYTAVAAAVDWTVYCPVLPAGWFVDSGQYRLAGGGRMEIGYHGPSGASLTLREGSFCTSADGCAPAGTDGGTAAFGDRDGTLIAASDGSWAIIVDAGQKPSWLIEGSGLDQAAFTKIAAGLVAVGG